jgi:hypothetical protein
VLPHLSADLPQRVNLRLRQHQVVPTGERRDTSGQVVERAPPRLRDTRLTALHRRDETARNLIVTYSNGALGRLDRGRAERITQSQ